MLSEHAQVLPEPLDVIVEQPLALNQAVGVLGHYSLVTVTEDSLTVHRLVQMVVRASHSPDDRRQWAAAAARLVNAAFPHEGSSEVAAWAAWPTSVLLLPHALAVADHAEGLEVEAETTASLRSAAGFYLWSRGQYRQALPLEEQALAGFRRVLGDDHPDTLKAMNNLAETRQALGDLDGGRQLHEQALAARREVLGEDHPDTMASMDNLGQLRRDLGDLDGARELHEQALAGRRRVLGDDHRDTLRSMDNLAAVKRDLEKL